MADARIEQNAPISGRTGRAGIYTAYTDDNGDRGELLLWRVGDSLPRQVAVSQNDITKVALAPAPDGSLWIIWIDSGPQDKVAARQLRADGTTLGPITRFDIPGGFLNLTQLVGVAQADRLDVLLNAGRRIYHTQALAVPPVRPGPGTVSGALSGRVTQTDGVPVPNALVEACPQPSGQCLSVITEGDGRYHFDGLTPGKYQVTAWPPASACAATSGKPRATCSPPVSSPPLPCRGWKIASRPTATTTGPPPDPDDG